MNATVGKLYSFDLNEEMLRLIREEFDPPKLAQNLAAAISDKKPEEIEKEGAEVFSRYGRELMKKAMQLGEEYPDRTYEVLKAAIDATGELSFPYVPERFIEIAYLGTQQFLTLPVLQNCFPRLVYKVVDCYTFRSVKAECGEKVANTLLCRNACITALDTLRQDLNLDFAIAMEAEMTKDGFCQFALKRI